MTDVLPVVAVLVVSTVANTVLNYAFVCPCRAARKWYYLPRHEAGWLMWARGLLGAAAIAFLVLTQPPTEAETYVLMVLCVTLTVYMIRKAWFHSRERPGRFKGWAAGRIRTNAHGRLRVDPAG